MKTFIRHTSLGNPKLSAWFGVDVNSKTSGCNGCDVLGLIAGMEECRTRFADELKALGIEIAGPERDFNVTLVRVNDSLHLCYELDESQYELLKKAGATEIFL